MIRKTNYSVDELFTVKKSTLLHSIKKQHDIAQTTQQTLLNFNIPYFNHTKVCFYNGTKLVLKTDIPELLSKFRELKKELITLLKTSDYFNRLEKLELILEFNFLGNQKDHHAKPAPQSAQTAFKHLADQINNDQIKHSIHTFLKKHYDQNN
ncbi:hypothetical protein [Fastidiosibacter lacustris]|uniref:hypothetical protein n=1 Tax=Fastidiosibacter lacustris TaxID=2056695 RepID=UPI000E350E4B|nr:hypothetical protein [Fastidiosibacter lacustris]